MAETINTQTTGCVGIEKIEQTYEGLFDNKPNIITIYLTNGDTHQFKVMNGSQGVGIDRIEQRQTSTVSGGRNEFAIILTNGKEYTFSTYNGSGGSGSSGSFNQVLQQLNNLLMPSGKSYLYYNGSGFEWKSPDGSTGGGTADLSEYSWWGRKFDPASKSITGEISGVTGIEFQSTNVETVIRKKLHLDKNGDLCFDGNFYATGGITALGSGGGTSGGSSASWGALLTKLNSDNPFPIASGQILTYNGSNFVWKTFTESGVALNPTMDAMNRGLTKTSYGTPQFLYWDGSKYTWKNESEISGGSGSSSRIDTIKLFNSLGSEFDSVNLGSANKIGFMQGDNVTLQAVVKDYTNVIKISATGGSGSSGTTTNKLYFRKDSSEESWNGEDRFIINFGSGLNVNWDSSTEITLSATGGSSTGGSVDLSSYLTKTEASTTYAAKYHTHSASSITGFEEAVKLIKVNNAVKADELNNDVYLWGNSFNGTNNINGNIRMGSAGGNSIQLWMNNGNMLDRTNNTLHIGYGLKESSDGEINLGANITKIYTDNYSKHYDFKSNVFDVNSNQIHFGSETNGGKISWDAANNAFKIEGNVYATGGITALGVSNSATTSNNVDFTFNKVSARGGTFENLAAGGVTFQNGSISYFQHTLSLKNDIMLYSGNSNCSLSLGNNTFTLRILSDTIKGFSSQGGGALSLNNVEKLIFGVTGQHYSRYKFDINKAISIGILVSTTETFSDEEADDTTVVAS